MRCVGKCPTESLFLDVLAAQGQIPAPAAELITLAEPAVSLLSPYKTPIVPFPAAALISLALGLSLGLRSRGQKSVSEPVDQIAEPIQLVSSIPVNIEPFPKRAVCPNQHVDTCGDTSARSRNGTCFPLLKRGTCSSSTWITVHPIDKTAVCSPRLCGRQKVFSGTDGLCRDVYDAADCSGGRRLYYTAYGDPICDCPIGQFPFPNPGDPCVPLFSQGPCPDGQVVEVTASGLRCSFSQCPPGGQIYFPDGRCYQLGTRGPCSTGQLFGFDILRSRTVCVDVTSTESPYSDVVEIESTDINLNVIRRSGTVINEPMLVPCRPGARQENNFKCTNVLVPIPGHQVTPTTRPAFRCPDGQFLMATGICWAGSEGASCGPSYEYVPELQRCRQSAKFMAANMFDANSCPSNFIS